MKERLKRLRKALNLTQQEFADRIGISRGNIATYETRDGSPGNSVINLICREFNVSKTWLRTGEGEMFIPTPNGVLDELAQKYGLSDRSKTIVARFLDLKPDIQEAIADYIEELAAAFSDTAPMDDGPEQKKLNTTGQARPEVDIAAKLEELERQNQELAAKVAAMEEERDEQLKADFGAALSALQSGLAGNAKKAKK